jgi:hypothetical protein
MENGMRKRATKTFTSAQLAERAIHRRAVEAVIWGMPAVNYELMFREMAVKLKGGFNQILLLATAPRLEEPDPYTKPDVIYLMPFFNTKDVGPMVLEIPPADGGLFKRQRHGSLAGRNRGHRPGRRGQGQGRQVPDPSAGLRLREGTHRLHPATV